MMLVRGEFQDFDAFKRALSSLQANRFDDYEAYSPVNIEDLGELMPRKGSLVRGISTGGALIGLGLFFYMCVATSLIYKLIVGGKPPVSNVPFVVVTYEGTILLGSIAAFVGAIILARLLHAEPVAGYDLKYSGDTFGIDIRCDINRLDEARKILKDAGATEIREEEQ